MILDLKSKDFNSFSDIRDLELRLLEELHKEDFDKVITSEEVQAIVKVLEVIKLKDLENYSLIIPILRVSSGIIALQFEYYYGTPRWDYLLIRSDCPINFSKKYLFGRDTLFEVDFTNFTLKDIQLLMGCEVLSSSTKREILFNLLNTTTLTSENIKQKVSQAEELERLSEEKEKEEKNRILMEERKKEEELRTLWESGKFEDEKIIINQDTLEFKYSKWGNSLATFCARFKFNKPIRDIIHFDDFKRRKDYTGDMLSLDCRFIDTICSQNVKAEVYISNRIFKMSFFQRAIMVDGVRIQKKHLDYAYQIANGKSEMIFNLVKFTDQQKDFLNLKEFSCFGVKIDINVKYKEKKTFEIEVFNKTKEFEWSILKEIFKSGRGITRYVDEKDGLELALSMGYTKQEFFDYIKSLKMLEKLSGDKE